MIYIMEYDRIPIILKRYTFESKMNICQKYSRKCMTEFDFNPAKKEYIFPWELEVFALFSIMRDKEYSNNEFKLKSDRRFNDMINSIRNYLHPVIKRANDSSDFVNKFFFVLPLIQCKYQEKRDIRLFRYNFIFTFKNDIINMKEVFYNKFNCEYNDFILLDAFFVNLLHSNTHAMYFNELDKVSKVFIKQIKHLLLSREDFIKVQNKFIDNNTDNYYYAFKYFYQFPFIEFNNTIYLPLPHLIDITITSSLLYRLTEGNGNLRALIGKEVLEEYLYFILEQSQVYDEVKKEVKYNIKRGETRHSPDVMIYKGDYCVLFDCKMSVPSTELLRFNESELQETIKRCAISIIKTYERIKEYGKYFNPFKLKKDFKKNNIFGVLVWLEDNHIRRNLIYKKVSEKLKLDFNSIEMDFIKSHVKFVGMRDVEECAFCSENYIDGLIEQRDDKNKWSDYDIGRSVLIKKRECSSNKSLSEFNDLIKDLSLKKFREIFNK